MSPCPTIEYSVAHFQKERKPGARVGARSIMGSFGGAHVHFFSNSWAPKRSHNSARAHSRPSFPLFLKVGYYPHCISFKELCTGHWCSNKIFTTYRPCEWPPAHYVYSWIWKFSRKNVYTSPSVCWNFSGDVSLKHVHVTFSCVITHCLKIDGAYKPYFFPMAFIRKDSRVPQSIQNKYQDDNIHLRRDTKAT